MAEGVAAAAKESLVGYISTNYDFPCVRGAARRHKRKRGATGEVVSLRIPFPAQAENSFCFSFYGLEGSLAQVAYVPNKKSRPCITQTSQITLETYTAFDGRALL